MKTTEIKEIVFSDVYRNLSEIYKYYDLKDRSWSMVNIETFVETFITLLASFGYLGVETFFRS